MPTGPGAPLSSLHDIRNPQDLTEIVRGATEQDARDQLVHFHRIEDAGELLHRLYEEDLNLDWSVAIASGIDHGEEASFSGHANDVVTLTGSGIALASDTGGVWIVFPGGGASCVSDSWGQPDMNALVVGPSDTQIMAAGKGLYVTDWTDPVPLFTWQPIPMPNRVTEVYRGVFVPDRAVAVLADDVGIHYSAWPSVPTGVWNWTQVPTIQEGEYRGIAVGPEGGVVASYRGVDLNRSFYGILVLRFTGSDLGLYTRATISGLDERKMTTISLTSSAADRNRLYAAAAGAGDDAQSLWGVLRSDDGGLSWRKCGTSLSTSIPNQGDLLQSAGNQGDAWNNCIAASHVDPNVVLLGWRNSGPFLSTDGGKSWQLKHADQDTAHLHSDIHAVRFDQHDATGRRFLICSDGGVVSTTDLGDTYESLWNVQVGDLQFQSMPARQFDGMFGVSPIAPGIIAGGLQDNGVVWGQVGADERWHQLAGGDGFRCIFLQTGQLVWTSNGKPAPQICDWKPVEMGQPLPVRVAIAKPPLPGNDDGLYDVTPATKDHWYRNTSLAALRRPGARDAGGDLMYAVGAVYGDVYGLYARKDGADPRWIYVGSVPIDISKYEVRSLASFQGLNVFVGTSDGRIFALDTMQQSALEMNVTTRTDDGTAITRITTYNSYEDSYAIHGNNLLRLSGLAWDKVSGLPDESLFSVAVDERFGDPAVFVASDGRVYFSRDGGKKWKIGSHGLPERPHGGDLAIGPSFGPEPTLYLATYGRSVWFTAIREP